ncbi:MAG: hypothetical protein VKL39_13420 [Leptolyngbyaceae bacterium]|nr:hypothetical protein [Leptolyngbyaceae bacterium]
MNRLHAGWIQSAISGITLNIGANTIQLVYPKYRQWFYSSRYVGSRQHIGEALGIGVTWQYAFSMDIWALRCPKCCAVNDDFDKVCHVLSSYHHQRNPSEIVCDICGYTSNLMNWNTDPPLAVEQPEIHTVAVGHLAVHLDAWPSLSDEAIAYFKELMGGNTRYLAYKF